MKDFNSLIKEAGVTAIFDHIHAVIIVAKKDGTLVSWNRAFEVFKAALPIDTKLQDLFKDWDEANSKLIAKNPDRWITGLFLDPVENALLCDCLLMPLDDEHFLLAAEHLHTDNATLDSMERLSKQVEVFKIEKDDAKKLAKRKEVEVQAVLAQTEEISRIDQLTHLPNRSLIIRELQNEALRARRYLTPFTISLLDIDHFKRINDTHGHMAGDEALKHLGEFLRDHIRTPDIAGRYGGEEFLILLPNSTSQDAIEQASRLCALIRELEIPLENGTLKMTVSIGIAEFKHETDAWDSLLSRADNALYEAKSSGRDRWMVAS